MSSFKTELKKAFCVFDSDGDGSITIEELQKVLLSLGVKASLPEVQKMIVNVDRDRSGTIDFEEFCDYMLPVLERHESDEQVRDMFKRFDADGNGYIDEMELKQMLERIMGKEVPMSEVKQMINDVDMNNDGRIDIYEFIKMMQE